MFAFITNIRAKPGQRAALATLTQTMMEQTATESGVPVYVFHQAEDDLDEFWFYDLYTSEKAYREHCSSEAFNAMISQVSELGDIKVMHKLIPYGPVKSAGTSLAI
jgi:quinol monooxygenase YgiN